MSEGLPRRLEDAGRFSLTVTIGPYRFKNSVTETGASVNMMPLSQVKKLGLLHMTPITMEIKMADGTSRKPVGKLLNILVLLKGS